MIKPNQTPSRREAFSIVGWLIILIIIAVLFLLLLPTITQTRVSPLARARLERTVLELAINNYHDKLGFYPPGNASATPSNLAPALTNQLFYELVGTVRNNDTSPVSFTTLDNSSTISSSLLPGTFGVNGFMNCSKGTGNDQFPGNMFLPNLRPSRIATNNNGVMVIVTAANSSGYAPMPGFHPLDGPNTANPWRYLCPGINNPNSYDLWLQIVAGGKTNLICNWKDQVNSPLP